MKYQIIDAPAYLEQLIIYEIATKGFTSPNGAESGTFASLTEKMPYLQELGINAIWLSGHQLCDAKHFYNIWTEYACIRPDRLDDSLGTEEDFRNMVACAHDHGIKVFLDVITHGVMENSPLIAEHPDWFTGGSWGMKDFDWYGGHKDLDEWWVTTWLRYVKEFGIDGYRLDVAHYRNDLWALIRKKAKECGREIVIIAENGPAIRGVTDVLQHGENLSHNWGKNDASRLFHNVADYCRDNQERRNEKFYAEVLYEDGELQTSTANEGLAKRKNLQILDITRESELVECDEAEVSYVNQVGILKIENVSQKKPIKNVLLQDVDGHTWNSNRESTLEVDYYIEYERKGTALYAKFPLRQQDGQYITIQMSCHDNGWDGFPLDENPYGIQGSRYVAGYSALLAPGIPIFMSGEEFNADYRAIPWHAPDLYGKGEEGKGRWLYGSWLDWEQLKIPEKAAMLSDMKRLISIRKEYSHLIKPCKMGETERNLRSVAYDAPEELPIPYIYQGGKEYLFVAANPEESKAVKVTFAFGEVLDHGKHYEVSVLFGKGETFVATVEELRERVFEIERDKQPGGGLLVLSIKETEE